MKVNCDSIENTSYEKEVFDKTSLKCVTNVDYLEVIESENVYLKVKSTDCQIRRDIEVNKTGYNRIYGTIYGSCKTPVENVVVNLIKYESFAGEIERKLISYSVTDKLGCFDFFIQKDEDINRYKVEIDCLLKCN